MPEYDHPAGHPGSHPGGHPSGHPSGHPGGHPGSHPGGHPSGHPHQGDNTSSGARGYRPGAGPAARAFEERTGIKAPRIIAWEITRRCNLLCEHCRASAECSAYPGELTLDECKAVMDDIASITDPILILTGGEPLMREDIWDIIDYAHKVGLHPVIGTNGTLITPEIAAKIAQYGIPRVSISLDFPTAEAQDKFRGKPGAFDEAVAGIKALNDNGVGVQVNTTITKMNVNVVDQVHELANSLGAVAFHPFLLVPTGRGEDLIDVELSPQEYEEVLTWAYHKQQCSPMHFKPTDSPQYYRIIRQEAAKEGREVTTETYGMEALTRGCLGGITFVFISHVGDVQPCGYFDMQLGNVKEQPFSKIWEESPVFDDLRHYDRLKGKCGACEYKAVCGGCRARALSLTGDYLEEEPYCAYLPRGLAQKRLLNIIQTDFPLCANPITELATRIEGRPEDVREALRVLYSKGVIRRVGASVAAAGVGYTSSLCALAVDPACIDQAGQIVAALPQVTHDYARSIDASLSVCNDDACTHAVGLDRYNLWFTLTARSTDEIEGLAHQVAEQAQADDVLVLPASSLYKIRVDFAAGTAHDDGADGTGVCTDAQPGRPFDATDEFDVALIRWAQGDCLEGFADAEDFDPYQAGAQVLSTALGRHIESDQVVQRLAELKASGAIRRFGAIVRHGKMGYGFNAMVAASVSEHASDAAGYELAKLRFVSHCYRRLRQQNWPFDLYAMVHATSEEELVERVEQVHRIVCEAQPDASVVVLRSGTEYKKTSMRYFEEDDTVK